MLESHCPGEEITEEEESGRDNPADGNANEGNQEQEADHQAGEEGKMVRKRMEMKVWRLRQLQANGMVFILAKMTVQQ